MNPLIRVPGSGGSHGGPSGRPHGDWLSFGPMSDLINVLPVLGAIIVLGGLALGAAPKPALKPVPVKRPQRR